MAIITSLERRYVTATTTLPNDLLRMKKCLFLMNLGEKTRLSAKLLWLINTEPRSMILVSINSNQLEAVVEKKSN